MVNGSLTKFPSFGLFPSSKLKQKHDVSEAGCVSIFR